MTVTCNLCQAEFRCVTNTHLKFSHNITLPEYHSLFPNAIISSEETRAMVQNRCVTVETRAKLSRINKGRTFSPEYWEKQRGHLLQPSRPEIMLESWLTEYFPNEWRYNDGWFILAGKVPDFVNVNGKKQVIELYGDYWHKGENPQGRIDLFNKYGFNCLVIWEHSLADKETVMNEIKEWSR